MGWIATGADCRNDHARLLHSVQGKRVHPRANAAPLVMRVDGVQINLADLDLVIQIEDVDGICESGDTKAVLTGKNYGGDNIEGRDSICRVP